MVFKAKLRMYAYIALAIIILVALIVSAIGSAFSTEGSALTSEINASREQILSENSYSNFFDIKYNTVGDGEVTGKYVFGMVQSLTNTLYTELQNEYGNANVATEYHSRSIYDTHYNAIVEDDWLWYHTATIDENEIKSYLSYNIYKILLGESTLTFTPANFVDNTEYNEKKASGEFSDENLLKLACQCDHAGFFYYELDNIAQYVLNNVIGSGIIARDNVKFNDVNNNGTFDYVENLAIGFDCIIKNYNLEFQRATEIQSNDVWSKINWDSSMIGLPEDGSLYSSERALTLVELKSKLDSLSLSDEAKLKYCDHGKNYSVENLSGFKNYVNKVYSILYSAMKEFTFSYNNGESVQNLTINNMLEQNFLSNVAENSIPAEASFPDMENKKFYTLAENYKSVVITAKKLYRLQTFYVYVANPLEEDLTMSISMKYHFTSDDYKEYIGTYNGESKTIEVNLGTLTLEAHTMITYVVDLRVNVDTLDYWHEQGVDYTTEDICPLAQAGIYQMVLVNNDTEQAYSNTVTGVTKGYFSTPSKTFVGSNFNFVNEDVDFFEITYNPQGKYNEAVKFNIGFYWF